MKIIKLAVATLLLSSVILGSVFADANWSIRPKYGWTSDNLQARSKLLADKYDFLSYEKVGSSAAGKEIYKLTLAKDADKMQGKDSEEVFNATYRHSLYIAGTHAKEHMNPYMLLTVVENYCKDYEDNSYVPQYDIRGLVDNGKLALDFVVNVNPDGTDYVKLRGDTNNRYEGKYGDGSSLKANLRGVDLNRNFPALAYSSWADKFFVVPNRASSIAYSPGPRFYGGSLGSEPETKALMDVIQKKPYESMISFHSMGRVIYGGQRYVDDTIFSNAYIINKMLIKVTGYKIVEGLGNLNIAGDSDNGRGYEVEYFTFMKNKAAYTVETCPRDATRYLYETETQDRGIWKLPIETAKRSAAFKIGDYKLYKNGVLYTTMSSEEYAKAYEKKYNLVLKVYEGTPKTLTEIEAESNEEVVEPPQ